MLSLEELNELEAKYENFISKNSPKVSIVGKNFYKYFIVLLLFIVLFVSGIYHFSKPKTISQNEPKAEESVSSQVKAELAKQNYKTENIIKQAINEAIEEKSLSANQSLPKPQEQILDQEPSQKQDISEQGYLNFAYIDSQNLDTASENFQEIPEQNIINLDEQKRQKPKITIKTKDISSTNDALKDKFKQTKDINSALNLARNYFEKREYTQALNWAMAANELDKNNKESWVIFAKAKYHLGQKQDALVALREFNSDKNLKDITLLIRKMQNGSL